jgi:hypothetical protein
MEKSSTMFVPPTLEEVRDQFRDWRRTRKNRRESIPPQLWKTAVKLANSYSINSISKALRLNYSDLKDHVHGQFAAEKVKALPAAKFIDLSCNRAFSGSECIVELQDAAGLKMKMSVRGKVDFNLLQVAKAFLTKGTHDPNHLPDANSAYGCLVDFEKASIAYPRYAKLCRDPILFADMC